jgi:hypothetical protein
VTRTNAAAGGPGPAAAATTARLATEEQGQRSAESDTVDDTDAAIRAVLHGDDEHLDKWRRREAGVRVALRDLPPSGPIDAARTLCAAARVERRRRAAAARFAEHLVAS